MDAEKQHEQLQQQVQAAEQQLEAAGGAKAAAEQQLAQAQEGLDRYVAAQKTVQAEKKGKEKEMYTALSVMVGASEPRSSSSPEKAYMEAAH